MPAVSFGVQKIKKVNSPIKTTRHTTFSFRVRIITCNQNIQLSPRQYTPTHFPVHENRWGDLLQPGIVLDQFKNGKGYKGFIKESVAKEFLDGAQLVDS